MLVSVGIIYKDFSSLDAPYYDVMQGTGSLPATCPACPALRGYACTPRETDSTGLFNKLYGR